MANNLMLMSPMRTKGILAPTNRSAKNWNRLELEWLS